MPDIMVTKGPGGILLPLREEDKEIIASMKMGDGIKMKYVKMRNPKMMKKFFIMLRIAFEHWEPAERQYKGIPVAKDFKKFREDITIAAGHCELVTNIRGETRAQAKSISFGNMSERDFDMFYYRVVDVCIRLVLTNYTRKDVDEVVDKLMKFSDDRRYT